METIEVIHLYFNTDNKSSCNCIAMNGSNYNRNILQLSAIPLS